MEFYDLDNLKNKKALMPLLQVFLKYKDLGLGCIFYSDGTLIVDVDGFTDKPSCFAKLRNEIIADNHAIRSFGLTSTDVIDDELTRARKVLSEDSEDSDDSEAQSIAETIISHAVLNSCSDVHIFLRDPNVEIRFNQFGQSTPPMFVSYDYDSLVQMVARLYNWSGANNSDGEFSLRSTQATTLTMDIKVDDTKIPTRLRIEKAPLETKGDAKVVIRVSPAVQSKSLQELKVNPLVSKLISQNMKKPSGMVIYSGPTGSGKTTLLHAGLHEIPAKAFTSTIEDPVEVLADFNPLISQHNLDHKLGYNNQIRSLLRQDPNIIAIGEMRDETTASAAIRASLTGHLVVTTLHTNNALGIPSRLADLGVSFREQSLPDVLSLLLATRLGQCVCQKCSTPLEKHRGTELYRTIADKPQVNLSAIRIKNPRGCKQCFNGISGRKPIIEAISVDSGFRELISNGDIDKAHKYLKKNGWQSLQELAWIEINKGIFDPFDAESTFKNILNDTNENYVYEAITNE